MADIDHSASPNRTGSSSDRSKFTYSWDSQPEDQNQAHNSQPAIIKISGDEEEEHQEAEHPLQETEDPSSEEDLNRAATREDNEQSEIEEKEETLAEMPLKIKKRSRIEATREDEEKVEKETRAEVQLKIKKRKKIEAESSPSSGRKGSNEMSQNREKEDGGRCVTVSGMAVGSETAKSKKDVTIGSGWDVADVSESAAADSEIEEEETLAEMKLVLKKTRIEAESSSSSGCKGSKEISQKLHKDDGSRCVTVSGIQPAVRVQSKKSNMMGSVAGSVGADDVSESIRGAENHQEHKGDEGSAGRVACNSDKPHGGANYAEEDEGGDEEVEQTLRQGSSHGIRDMHVTRLNRLNR